MAHRPAIRPSAIKTHPTASRVSSQLPIEWGFNFVSEDRLATLLHAPSRWKVAGQSFAGQPDRVSVRYRLLARAPWRGAQVAASLPDQHHAVRLGYDRG